MLPRRRLRLAASGGVLLALVGVWLGHTVEYVRVEGTAGLREELVGSIHWYMAPVGVVLALLAAATAVGAWRLWTRLGGQLAAARHALARAWRDDGSARDHRSPGGGSPPAGAELRISRLWPLLAVVQIGLYVLQENIETAAVGLPAPGLHALTGTHWAASLVHAAVALLLAAVVVGIRRALHHRSGAVRAVRALLDVLLGVVRPGDTHPVTSVVVPRPADRFGRLWCRPPPLLLVTG